MGTVGGGSRWGGGGQNRYSNLLIFKRFPAKFFPQFQGGSPMVKKDSLNLTFTACLHTNFPSRFIMVPRGPKGVL